MTSDHAAAGSHTTGDGAATEWPVVIDVDGVGKRFDLRHTRSIKEYAIWALKGRQGELNESFMALDGVSFTISQGESVALLGFNGSGKSTTLKLLSGVLRPDVGSVRIRGRIAGLIEVGAGFHPDLTGRENVYLNGAILGMSEAEIDQKFDDIVAFSEIEKFIDTEVKFYSSGMFLRLAFSVAVYSDPDIFLIDEILAVGDEPFQRKCIGRIKELHDLGQTLVVVSHDLDMVTRVCDRGIVLDHGRLVYDGDVRDAVRYLRSGPQGGALRPHQTPLFTEWDLKPWVTSRPFEILPERLVQATAGPGPLRGEISLATGFATIDTHGLAAGSTLAFDLGDARVELTSDADGVAMRGVASDGTVTPLGTHEGRPDRIAFTLTGPIVTVWGDQGDAGLSSLLQASVAPLADVNGEAARGRLRARWSGEATSLRAGRFGWLGVRDPHLVQDPWGKPIYRDGRALLTLTCAGPDGFPTAHCGVFSIDPEDPRDLRHEGDLFFERDGRVLGDHAGQIMVSDDLVEARFSTWGDVDKANPWVNVRRGVLPHLPVDGETLVVPSEPFEVPTELPCWDPDLRRIGDEWYLGFVECFARGARLEFRPALGKAPDVDGRPGTFERIGADEMHHQTEGTLFWTDDAGTTWLMASDGDARDYPVYDLQMIRRGRLAAPYGTGIPHTCLIPRGEGRTPIMVTFDESAARATLPYGSHGNLLVYAAEGTNEF